MSEHKALIILALTILAAPSCGGESAPRSQETTATLAPTPQLKAAMELASAQAFEHSRKTKQALEAYRRIQKEYPESPQAKVAGEREKALGGR